ncbi:Two-on-two hemoglobin-3 [Spatholobus suberectus]|nr:Two-on-two hemoglobin-3 [Spatholobus suberectus]
MQSLQQKASEWSGVPTDDAFAIDDTNLFQKLGLQTFINLSTNFYTSRVYDDEEEWFRSIFASSEKENAIQNQYEFFVQRMGGPPLFSQRRGHPALIARHRPFPVTHQAAERWLHHMQQALDSTPDIDDDSKTKMMKFFRFIFCPNAPLPDKWLSMITLTLLLFFRHTAYFLVAGDELKNQNQQIPCKHAARRDDS